MAEANTRDTQILRQQEQDEQQAQSQGQAESVEALKPTLIAWSSALLVLINSLSKENFISVEERTFLKKEVFCFNATLLIGFKRYLIDRQISELVRAINIVLEPLREGVQNYQPGTTGVIPVIGSRVRQQQQQQQQQQQLQQQASAQSNNGSRQASEQQRSLFRNSSNYIPEEGNEDEYDSDDFEEYENNGNAQVEAKDEEKDEGAIVDDADVQLEFAEQANAKRSSGTTVPPPPPPIEEDRSDLHLKWPLGARSSLQLSDQELEHIQSVLQLLGLHHISPASLLIIFRKADLLDEIPRSGIAFIADKISRKLSRMVRLSTTRLPNEEDDEALDSEDEDDAAESYDAEREARFEASETESESIMRKLRFLLIANILYITFDLVNLENAESIGVTQLISALSLFTAADPSEITRFVSDLLAVETAAEKHAGATTTMADVDGISIQLIIRYLYCVASVLEAMLMLPRPDAPGFTTKLVSFFKDPTLSTEARKRSVNNVSRCARFLFGNRPEAAQCSLEEEISPEEFAAWPHSPIMLVSRLLVLPSLIQLKQANARVRASEQEQESSATEEESQAASSNKATGGSQTQEETAPTQAKDTSGEEEADVEDEQEGEDVPEGGDYEDTKTEDVYDEDQFVQDLFDQYGGNEEFTDESGHPSEMNAEQLLERLNRLRTMVELFKARAGVDDSAGDLAGMFDFEPDYDEDAHDDDNDYGHPEDTADDEEEEDEEQPVRQIPINATAPSNSPESEAPIGRSPVKSAQTTSPNTTSSPTKPNPKQNIYTMFASRSPRRVKDGIDLEALD